MGISHLNLSPRVPTARADRSRRYARKNSGNGRRIFLYGHRGKLIISRLIGAANAVFPAKAGTEIPHRHLQHVVTQRRYPGRIVARRGAGDQVEVHTSICNMSKIAQLTREYGGELRDSKPAERHQIERGQFIEDGVLVARNRAAVS
jgi:hypothetical protein